MSETKKITALPTASSIASSDSLLIADSNGNLKRMSASVFENRNTQSVGSTAFDGFTSGWIRVASLSGEGFGLLYCISGWGSSYPQSLLLSVKTHPSGGASTNTIVNILPHDSTTPKGRIVRNGTNAFVDIYYANRPYSFQTIYLAGKNVTLLPIEVNPQLADTDVIYESLWGG